MDCGSQRVLWGRRGAACGGRGRRGRPFCPLPQPLRKGGAAQLELLGSEGRAGANQRFLEDHPHCPSYFGSPGRFCRLARHPWPAPGADCPSRPGPLCRSSWLAPSAARLPGDEQQGKFENWDLNRLT